MALESQSAQAKTPDNDRNLGLDALRGLAALSVVLFHFTVAFEDYQPHNAPIPHFNFPSLGVQIFFVISGYVIFMTLERSRNLADFAVSRFARLYPAFVVCALLTLVAVWGTGFNPQNITVLKALSNLTLVVGLTSKTFIDPAYWTLTLEVCFYVYISVLFFLFSKLTVNAEGKARQPTNLILGALSVWVILSFVLRSLDVVEPVSRLWFLINTYYCHLFAAGVALYVWRARKSLFAATTLCIALIFGGLQSWQSPGLGGIAKAVFDVAAVWLCLTPWAGFLSWRPFVFLGAISYSLYLLHQILGIALIKALEDNGVSAWFAVPLVLAIVILMAWAVRVGIEVPCQTLIRNAYKNYKARQINTKVKEKA